MRADPSPERSGPPRTSEAESATRPEATPESTTRPDAAAEQPGPRPGDPTSVRLDVWLWSVRQARTRSAATADCRGGHVRLNGAPVKASQSVRLGDEVRVRRPGIEHVLVVRRLLAKRVGAPIARTAYEDLTPPPPPQMLARPPRRDQGTGRPTKKERRELDHLLGRDADGR